jgi:hypothetical protein
LPFIRILLGNVRRKREEDLLVTAFFTSIAFRIIASVPITHQLLFCFATVLHMGLKVGTAIIILAGEARLLSEDKISADMFNNSLETAADYAEVWQTVKDSVEFALRKRRGSMMLFLDDLPLQLGAYHPLGTNNIVLNRALIEIVETSISTKRVVNALVYNLLLHEYLHALGEISENKVRRTVVKVAKACFGEKHIATVIAQKSPWVLLQKIPLQTVNAPKRVMQIVTDFEKTGKYIV